MITTLKPNERLVPAGETAFRAPDGTPLPGEPQYTIADGTEPAAAAVALQADERLVMVGSVHTDRKASMARYELAKAGKNRPTFDGRALYVKEAVCGGDKPGGLSAAGRKVCDGLVGDLLSEFIAQETEEPK